MAFYEIENVTSDIATIDKFQNLVPISGSVYGTDGQKYTKLPIGTNGQSLTADSTTTQGLAWKPYFDDINPTITFSLFACIGWSQNETFYNSIGTNPPGGNHDVPNVISFNFDTTVVAMGLKPRASTNSGDWADSLARLWEGTLYFDIVGCADGADPNLGLTPMTTPPAPHFTVSDTEISTVFMAKYIIPSTPIFIPARTKFSLRTTWAPGTVFNDPNDDKYGTGTLIIRGVPN
jgi:hypothetical protein